MADIKTAPYPCYCYLLT